MPQRERVYRKRLRRTVRRRRSRKKRLRQRHEAAERYIRKFEQGLAELGLERHLVQGLARKIRRQGRLMSKLFAMMFPPLFGVRSYQELGRTLGWGKGLAGRILSAWPKQRWLGTLRSIGLEIVSTLWARVQDKSAATRSRWKMTFVADDSVFRKYGKKLGLVGSWYSGQEKRVVLGVDGLLLLVIFGDGKLVVPIDFAVRRPDPEGAGHPSRDKMQWLQVMFGRSVEGLQARGLDLGEPMLVADGWFASAGLMRAVAQSSGSTLLVEGKSTHIFTLQDGRKLTGKELLAADALPWRDAANLPGVRYARVHATSPSFGPVTLTLVKKAGDEPRYLLCRKTSLSSVCLIQAYDRRPWIEWCFRTLKHLLAVEVCQTCNEAAYIGHVVLRLLGFTLLTYTVRRLLHAHHTMENILETIRCHWQSINSDLLEYQYVS